MKASMHPRDNADGTTSYRVRWRQKDPSGKVLQKTQTFEDFVSGERFRRNVEKFGPARALEIVGIEDADGESGMTLLQACEAHVSNLTGVEPGTINRYRAYMRNDLVEIGSLPLTAITDTTVSGWIQWLQFEVGNSGKTCANKHGYLSAVLERAREAGHITTNPCAKTRLPDKTPKVEPVFLSREEFAELLAATPDHWKPLMTWLAGTGTRFSEATAVQYGDIDRRNDTCRIVRSWKYTATGAARLGPPKTKKGRRTINLPAQAIEAAGTGPAGSLVFTNPAGNRVTYPRFYESAWEVATSKSGITCKPHDLRHSAASWLIQAGVPLPVIQAHLGHESITTTVNIYGHLDRSSHQQAATALGAMLG